MVVPRNKSKVELECMDCGAKEEMIVEHDWNLSEEAVELRTICMKCDAREMVVVRITDITDLPQEDLPDRVQNVIKEMVNTVSEATPDERTQLYRAYHDTYEYLRKTFKCSVEP